MTYQLTHVRLLVQNFAECFRFYRDVMGFEYRAGDESGPYVEFYAGEQVMLGLFIREYQAHVAHTQDLPAQVSAQDRVALTFAVDSVDDMAKQLQSHGVEMVNQPMDMAQWELRVAHFRDPAGNLIEINQPLASA